MYNFFEVPGKACIYVEYKRPCIGYICDKGIGQKLEVGTVQIGLISFKNHD